MKSKVQKRREACARIKSALPHQERAVLEAAYQITAPVDKDELRWYHSIDHVRQSRIERHASLQTRLRKMKDEIAHLESLG